MKQPRYITSTLLLVFVVAFAFGAGACGGSGGPILTFGLAEREQLEGLTFPDVLPQPTPLQTERAFPNLSFGLPVYFAVAPDQTNRNRSISPSPRIKPTGISSPT